jgi:guanylate kinase
MSSRRGSLFVVSAPSGAGKTTVVRRMIERTPGVGISRSYTSRPIRQGERDGVDYTFVSEARFVELREAGTFLEWAVVFGDLYGTGRPDTEARLASGEDLVLVIDVQGARTVRAAGVESIGIFLMPPSFGVLEERLRGRSRDPEAAILRRLATAREEITAYPEYDHVVVNDDIESCVDQVRAIVIAARSRRDRVQAEAEAIASTFATSPSR